MFLAVGKINLKNIRTSRNALQEMAVYEYEKSSYTTFEKYIFLYARIAHFSSIVQQDLTGVFFI